MSRNIPLGEAEGQKLEFKGKDALKHLPNISREVVAMLNSGGGEIWIGLGEEHGRAVRIEPVENADREISRLRDHLSDAIEPSPIATEINVEAVGIENNGTILRVWVKPSSGRRPYDLREGTARHFLKRIDDRLRPMTREEIISNPAAVDSGRSKALRKIENARKHQSREENFWLRIQPVDDGNLELGNDFQPYFSDYQRTGNRNAGWNFIDPYSRIEREGEAIKFGHKEGPCVRVFRDGAIEFTMPVINLYWKNATDFLNRVNGKEIWPYCLLEYPTSIFRLASAIYREKHLSSERFLAELALFGAKDWTLRPHSPMSLRYKLAAPKALEADEIVLDEPVDFSRKQIVEEPDRCAFRLVTKIYFKFGLWEEDMPLEFNQATGRLVLPGT
jgi:hypothetical protein